MLNRKKLISLFRVPLNTKMKKYAIVFCSLLTAVVSFSQESDIRFGIIPHSDIIMKNYASEPDSEAVILAKTRSIKYQTDPTEKQLIKHYERIKIFKESAFDLGEVAFEFYHFEDFETIQHLRAMITYPNGERLELDKRHVKAKELNDKWTEVIIKFPNLLKGCVIEYEYTLAKDYISTPEDFVFQSEIPLRYALFTYEIPKTINYTFFAVGEKYIQVGESDFTMINVPSIQKDAFITIMDDYTGKIKTRIESYYDFYIVKQVINPRVETMVKNLVNDRLFGHQYNKEIYGRKMIAASKHILEEEIPVIEKINKLQAFILDNVSWNGNMEVMCRKPINKLFKDGKAGSTELNLMLLVLMKKLNIEAYPVLISTRNNGQAYSVFPLESDFSYAVVFAEIDGSTMLFDISDKLKPSSMLNYQALNEYGLVMKADAPFWVKTIPEVSTDIYLGEFQIDDDILKGKFTTKHSNYSAFFERDFTRDDDFLDHWKLDFQKRYPRAHVYEGSHENLDSISKEFKQEFALSLPGAVSEKSDTIYVSPYVYGAYDENPFVLENRGYEIDFAYPFTEQYIFRLEIPSGYEVLQIPEKFVAATPDRMASVQIVTSIIDNRIQIIKKIEMNKAIYPEEETSAIITLFKEIEERTKEKIILVLKEE